MKILHNKILSHISEILEKNISISFPDAQMTREDLYTNISEPPNREMGHYAFPCFFLAKQLKNSPVNIAKELLANIPEDTVIEKATLQGPYINFFIKSSAFGELGILNILSGDFANDTLLDKTEKIMFEYSQPNTHKELHVGHMRNLCFGNALVRMNNYIGNKSIAATYPGDVGTHVAKCLWYLKFHNQDEIPTESKEKGPWLGALYSKATAKLDDEKGTPKEDENRKLLTQILKELEEGKGEYYDTWRETREWSINLMKDVYKWADVKFDRWFFESEVDSPSLQFAKNLYEEGKLIESDGAIGMDLSDDKLGFCMLVKTDGTGLYATKDISLAHLKFEEYGLDKSYYIVDKRQAFHFQQVFKVLEKIGFNHANDSVHLQYDFVELPDGAMSSRKGNIVPLTDLIEQMQDTIKKNYLEKYRGEWTDEDIDYTAEIIAGGAIKYGMIRMDHTRKIVFDMNEWLKLDGETGPYLQYVCARINSLCEKQNYIPDFSAQWSLLTTKQEQNLMQKLTMFNEIVEKATSQHKTSHICGYLYELGKLFNAFYAECSIAKAESDGLKQARLSLSKATELVMKQGLSILGIKAPTRM